MTSLKPGDLVLFSHTRFFDKLVRWFTNSEFSHAGIVYEIGEKYILVGEAWGTGFDIRKRRVKEIYSCRVRRSSIDLVDVLPVIKKYVGSPYDKLNIFGLVFYKYFRIKFFETSANNLTCSEASARFFYDSSNKGINFEKEFSKPYDYITPADLSLSNQLYDLDIHL
ncbi:MAG: hypothetical protein IPM56_05755 [Ignavibacteriales bacterium]|nr:MAG: hypothetical protein IPM56_05755 [Ignavibacteriales bacterium]